MRMGTNTNIVVALGTSIDLDLNPYENNDGYDCGHPYEYTYAYAYAHGHAQRDWYRYGCVCMDMRASRWTRGTRHVI